MVLFTFSLLVLLRLVFDGILWLCVGLGLACPCLVNLAGPVQHFKAAILDAWRNKFSADLLRQGGFPEWSIAGCAWPLTAS